jgi:LmbE family N-acetylglucosaminyl deacetylase
MRQGSLTGPVVLAALFLGGFLVVDHPRIGAQVQPVYDQGAAGLTQQLQRLQTTASALHTGAHPDDEDSAFIARTARGDHARVAYLSLNRGEGGQNIIGPELFEALGVIRTEELLQARRLDGGEQFFTRTFDFGFSKARSEAAAKWNEREVLGDMVRVIRRFRPLVIYSRFTGTPADGHGHHQLAGYLTPLAFKAAADPNEFSEQLAEGLRPWQARKLYRGVGFRPDPANPPTIRLQTGVVNPVIGRTFAQIAAEGRSQHRSQQMGSVEPLGPMSTGLRLVESAVPVPSTEQSIFDGLDVTVSGLAVLAGLPAGTIDAELQAMETAAGEALRGYQPLNPGGTVPALAAGLRAARAARDRLQSVGASAAARADADFLLSRKDQEFAEALAHAAGVVVDPLIDEETIVPGEAAVATVRTFLSDPKLAAVTSTALDAPAGWTVEPAPPAGARDDGPFAVRETPAAASRYRVVAPVDALPTQPYFLSLPRRGDSYEWPEGAPKGMPFDPPLLSGRVTLEIAGVTLTIVRPLMYRHADGILGELRRNLHVVPALTVGVDSRLLVVPASGPARPQRLVVRTTSWSTRPVSGLLRLHVPPGWSSTPATAPFTLDSRGGASSAAFVITPPGQRAAGTEVIRAEAAAGGRVFSLDAQIVAYPHIQTHRLYSPTVVTARIVDLEVAPVAVGYIMGSGDQVPEAIRRMGLDVTLIDAEMLGTGDLSRFDTIVVGVRASEARPDFVANHARLREYIERGGTLIVQYQQTDYVARSLPPYPARSAGNNRVTDETAAVRILAPDHPVFVYPNRITAADFDGWVQERNLYSFDSFDPRYVPLLESADSGEPPQRGGELYAEVGRGRYVYTAYAWFRQLPAGVPGAYRQFANLISLPRAPRTAGRR